MASAQQVRDLAALLTAHTVLSPTDAQSYAENFALLASRLHRLYMRQTNTRELTAKEQAKELAYVAAATELARSIHVGLEVNDDPRGYALYIRLRSGQSNSMGGNGWGI